jgi:colicin import membrane protein
MSRRHLLALVLLVAGVARAQGAALNVITEVSVRDEGRSVVLAVRGSKPPNFTTFSMADPPRFVIDFSESRFQGVPGDLAVNDGTILLVKNLSYGSDASSIARIMLAFVTDVDPPDVAAAGDTLLVRIAKPSSGGAALVAQREDAGRREREAAEARERAEAEAQARIAAEQRARDEALAQAEREAQAAREAREAQEAQAAREAQEAQEARARGEAERRAVEEAAQAAANEGREAERRARAEAEALARAEREAELRAGAEREARAEEERQARVRAEEERHAERQRAEERERTEAARAEAERQREALERSEAERLAREEDQRQEAEAARLAGEAEAQRREEERVAVAAAREEESRAREDAQLAVPAPSAQLREIGFRQLPGISRVYVRTSATPRFTIQDIGENTIRVELENTRVATRNDTRHLDTSFFPGAVALISPSKRGSTYVVDIQLKHRVPYQQRIEGDVLAIDFERGPSAGAETAAAAIAPDATPEPDALGDGAAN